MRLLIFLKIFLFLFSIDSVASALETRLAFSDLLPNKLEEFLYQDEIFLEKNLSSEIISLSISKSGSLPIIEDFLSDRLDLCILALPEGEDFPKLDDDNLVKIPFAYKSSIIVVNAENPISEITSNELSTIYGTSSSTSNLLNWRDFGISSFSTSTIRAYTVKEENDLSMDLFRHIILKNMSFNSSVYSDKLENIKRIISQDKSAVGIFPIIPSDSNLKVLFVSKDDDSIAYGPSIDNIYYSDYHIRIPFYIVFNVNDSARLYPLVSILLSDSVANILDENRFFSIPKVIREKLSIDMQLYMQENAK